MNEFNQLIKDDVLDKEQLILKRHRFLDIDPIKAQYIAKLFKDKELDTSSLTLKEIANSTSIPVESAEALTKELVAKGLVSIKNEGNEYRFNYDTLVNKIIKSYIAPEHERPTSEKLNWVVKTLTVELTDANINDLELIINEDGWENLKIAINKIVTLEDQTWHQLISMYEALGAKEKTESNEIKNILDKNWLEN